jgi:hypothetical protein
LRYSPKYKLSVHQIYEQAASKDASEFLLEVIKEMPLKIKDIQVDGGSEFRADFEDYCQSLNIPLFVLPPRKPNLNAGVERLNRTSQEEYFLCSFHKLLDNFNDLHSFVKQKQFHSGNDDLYLLECRLIIN